MESTILEELLSPWWKILLYILGLAVAIIAIKIVIKFDVNVWLKDRRTNKAKKKYEHQVLQCNHGWTLYPDSAYSQCNGCQALIQTSTLMVALNLADEKPIIMGTRYGIVIHPKRGALVVKDYK